MRTRWIAACTAMAWLAWGCQQAPEAAPQKVPAAAAATAAAPAKPAPKAAAKPAAKAAKPAPKPAAKPAVATKTAAKPASKLVRWDAPITWMDWDAGLAKAKADNKAVLLMVYADW